LQNTEIGLAVMGKRILRIRPDGTQEAPEEMLWRVSNFVARAEEYYDQTKGNSERFARQIYEIQDNQDFFFNSPTYTGAGTELGQLSACFVCPIDDSLTTPQGTGIYDTLRDQALIHQTGGGTGFDFSRIRPKGASVRRSQGVASGPISFMKVYNASTDGIKQGGCFPGNTLVATANGPVPIKDLKKGTLVYAWDGKFVLTPCTDSWVTKRNTEVWKVTTDKGLTILATPDHPFMVRWSGPGSKKEYVKLRDLKPDMPLMPLTRYIKDSEWWISLHDGHDTRMPEHIWMALELGITGEHIHHKDGKHLNNRPDNLIGTSHSEHASYHGKLRYEEGNHPFLHLTEAQRTKGVDGWKEWYHGLSDAERDAYWQKVSAAKSEWNKRRMADGTHNFVTNHPWKDEGTKLKAKMSRIAASIWKVLGKGLPVTESDWEKSAKDAGLYNAQRFTMKAILDVFGSWNNAMAYVDTRNHRVVSVEFSHLEDVYNVEVPGPHNYVVCDEEMRGVVVSNTRRGANMGIIRIDHPDVLEFIHCKDDTTQITNFNISIAVTDAFMAALEVGDDYELVHQGISYGSVSAQFVWDQMLQSAWKTGEPGIVFIDRINRRNPNNGAEVIEATNPCGEQPLPPYASCNLGSINLGNFVVDPYSHQARVDWDRLSKVVRIATHALDNIIDMNSYPIPQLREKALRDRRIGLGVMGWAEMLVALTVPYDCVQATATAFDVRSFIKYHSLQESKSLAVSRGVYPDWVSSQWATACVPTRNATLMTVAPTGTISLFASKPNQPCSGGIEPKFAVAMTRNQAGMTMLDVDGQFRALAERHNFWSEELEAHLMEHGHLKTDLVPYWVTRLFPMANDIAPEWHVKMQAAWQGDDREDIEQTICAAVSKTINFANSATIEDVSTAYRLAWETGCKGVTVYRDGSRWGQVLTAGKKTDEPKEVSLLSVAQEMIETSCAHGSCEIPVAFTESEVICST